MPGQKSLAFLRILTKKALMKNSGEPPSPTSSGVGSVMSQSRTEIIRVLLRRIFSPKRIRTLIIFGLLGANAILPSGIQWHDRWKDENGVAFERYSRLLRVVTQVQAPNGKTGFSGRKVFVTSKSGLLATKGFRTRGKNEYQWAVRIGPMPEDPAASERDSLPRALPPR